MSTVARIRGRWEMNDAQDRWLQVTPCCKLRLCDARLQLERDVALRRRQSYEALEDADRLECGQATARGFGRAGSRVT
jgi:hypothetical protein